MSIPEEFLAWPLGMSKHARCLHQFTRWTPQLLLSLSAHLLTQTAQFIEEFGEKVTHLSGMPFVL